MCCMLNTELSQQQRRFKGDSACSGGKDGRRNYAFPMAACQRRRDGGTGRPRVAVEPTFVGGDRHALLLRHLLLSPLRHLCLLSLSLSLSLYALRSGGRLRLGDATSNLCLANNVVGACAGCWQHLCAAPTTQLRLTFAVGGVAAN